MTAHRARRRPPRTIDEPITLTRVYTRHGDGGETRLGDGTRTRKSDARVEAYGTVDELNATLGLVLADRTLPAFVRATLTRIQNELFDLGASDLLFILARHVNAAQAIAEPLWRPGASTTARSPEAIFST